jgi:hypothetical protein
MSTSDLLDRKEDIARATEELRGTLRELILEVARNSGDWSYEMDRFVDSLVGLIDAKR